MKAILLAAGLGTRLRPLTDNIPKCLVLIHGIPLLQIWLEKLSNAGVTEILINTHYLSTQVETFINNSPFKNKCKIVYEEVLLGTAGTLIKNISFTNGEDCLLIHADNYCLDNFKNFIISHKIKPKICLMTMMTFRSENPSSCGIVELDENKVVIGFHEKVESPIGNIANGAIYLLSSELIKIIGEKFSTMTDFSTEILCNFLGKIYTFETKELFMDIGTPEAYLKANSF